MREKFTVSQIQTVCVLLNNMLQAVFKPLHFECLAQAKVLNDMKQHGVELAQATDIALNDARASLCERQEIDQDYRVALAKALQSIFGGSLDAEILEQIREDLGLVN